MLVHGLRRWANIYPALVDVCDSWVDAYIMCCFLKDLTERLMNRLHTISCHLYCHSLTNLIGVFSAGVDSTTKEGDLCINTFRRLEYDVK